MTNMFRKSFEDADAVKTPDKTQASVVKLGNVNVTKLIPPDARGHDKVTSH